MTDVAATVSTCLQVHGSLTSDEIEAIWHHWSSLDTRLRGFEPNAVTMDLYVKDRDVPGQHLTLETKIAGWPVLVATTSEPELDHALNVVRDEMIRLVTDAKETHRHGRHGRSRTAG
jgi:hypothetical protein